MSNRCVAAVDLGATSGRVMVGALSSAPTPRLRLEQTARFPNTPLHTEAGLHWDFPALWGHITAGIQQAVHTHQPASLGIDSWAVDYSLLVGGEHSLPFHYRDERTQAGVKNTHQVVPFKELYRRNGLQFLPFNTVYQLAVEPDLTQAEHLLLIPDLVAHLLTGAVRTERTNASTTGLLGTGGEWDTDLMEHLSIPTHLFAELIDPGEVIGTINHPELPTAAGLPVLAVGSHDTASAIAAIPMNPDKAAYISCGTWGLVGVETPAPITTDAAREANFTNEGGVDRRNRFLHNVMGLWLLSESLRTWNQSLPADKQWQLTDLLNQAGALTPPEHRWVFDANDPVFLPPGDMPTRIQTWLNQRGLPAPTTPVEVVRSIIESLAHAFAGAVRTAAELSGIHPEVIHIVGGGALNELLCQRTADISGLPVLAGPIEATAIGNLLVQARHHRWIGPDLKDLRQVVADSFEPARYQPRTY